MTQKLLNKVCYLGDGSITGAASYLSAILTHYGIGFDRIDSGSAPSSDFLSNRYALYILSDYPSRCFSSKAELEHIAESVRTHGSGLLMIGGWESFRGSDGFYNKTVIADIVPVQIQDDDDRRNSSLPIILNPCVKHPILAGLPWNWPAYAGGFNKFSPKVDAKVLLNGITIDMRILGDEVEDSSFQYNSTFEGTPIEEQGTVILPSNETLAFRPVRSDPILVTGSYGIGRTAAYASDVAPHWCGGFVDWGTPRIQQEVAGDLKEFGCWYAMFWRNLVKWTARMD